MLTNHNTLLDGTQKFIMNIYEIYTVCPKIPDPIFYSKLLYKMSKDFLDIQYIKLPLWDQGFGSGSSWSGSDLKEKIRSGSDPCKKS